MSFQPYRCLHVPVREARLMGAAVKSWPVGVILAGLVLAYWWCGPWMFVMPVICVLVIGAITAQVLRLHIGDRPPAPTAGPVDSACGWDQAVDSAAVVVEPVGASVVYVCLRCQARLAVTVATVRGQRIPLCGPCRTPALAQIRHAARRELDR